MDLFWTEEAVPTYVQVLSKGYDSMLLLTGRLRLQQDQLLLQVHACALTLRHVSCQAGGLVLRLGELLCQQCSLSAHVVCRLSVRLALPLQLCTPALPLLAACACLLCSSLLT